MSTLKNSLASAAMKSAVNRADFILANFKDFYDAFSASLRHGKASQVLEHDELVAIALSLGKTYTLHNIAVRSGSSVNILPIVLQLHNEYERIHGECFNG